MPYRDPDGILSDFNRTPGQLDEFRIKSPFSGDTSSLDSLEQANDWNQYFDACLRLESYLQNRIGGPLQTGESGSDDKIGAPNLYMSYEVLSTASSSGTITSIAGTVPSEFGDNPFRDPRFGVVHTLYLDHGGTPIAGVYANKPNNSLGYLNDLIAFPQYYVAIAPTATGATGRDFTVQIMKLSPFGGLFTDSFHRTGSYSSWERDSGAAESLNVYPLGAGWTVTDTKGRATFGCVQRTQQVVPGEGGRGGGGLRWSLILAAERSNNPCGGTAFPLSFGSGTDMHCDFQYHDRGDINVENNEYVHSCGIVLRFGGTTLSASGYALYWGGFIEDPPGELYGDEGWSRVQLVRLNGVDLSATRGGFTDPYTAGNILNLSGTGYHTLVWGGSGGIPHFYRFQVEGTTLSLLERVGTEPWTTVLTASDSSISSGQAGFFVQPMDDASCRYLFLTDVSFQHENISDAVAFSVPIIYTLAGKLDGMILGHE